MPRFERTALCWGCNLRVPVRLTSKHPSVWGSEGDYCAECWPDSSKDPRERSLARDEVASIRTRDWSTRDARG